MITFTSFTMQLAQQTRASVTARASVAGRVAPRPSALACQARLNAPVHSQALSAANVACAAPLRARCVAPRRAGRHVAVQARAEISYVMVKPDGVQRGLVGEIIGRFERKGFKLVALKLYQTPKDVAEEHYKDLSSKPFYADLVKYILSGPVVAMVGGRRTTGRRACRGLGAGGRALPACAALPMGMHARRRARAH
jgi:hypothetical protein